MTGGYEADKFKKITVASILTAMCLALAACSYLAGAWVSGLADELGALERENAAMTAGANRLMARKRALIASVEKLEEYCRVPLSRPELYSELRQIARDSVVDILSTRDEDISSEHDSVCSITMVLRGNYYGIMCMMAACRRLPNPVRAVRLAAHPRAAGGYGETTSHVEPLAYPSQQGGIEAEITLEAILASR